MPSDAARQTQQPALIRTPDQLQQARQPDPAPPSVGAATENGAPAPRPPRPPRAEGVLGQLETERAHD